MEIPSTMTSLSILLVLLPGFLTLGVERILAYQRADSSIDKIVKALIYSFVNYVLLLTISRNDLLTWRVQQVSDKESFYSFSTDLNGVLLLSIIAIVVGCVVGILKTYDLHMKIARFLRLTRRSSRDSIWLDIIHDKCAIPTRKSAENATYVIVHLKDGKSIYGYPEYFSDNYEEGPVIFLTKADWFLENGDKIPIPSPGILINASEIRFVQFYKILKEDEDENPNYRGTE
ncbi:MAG: DUF6338 family protein [bacterium]|nr:DUF6338 family protein [bacterium]